MNTLKKETSSVTENAIESPKSGPVTGAGNAITAQEIAAAVWPTFCRSFTASYHGMCTTVERVEDPEERKIECMERPLEQLGAVILESGVMAIHVTVGSNSRRRAFVAPGPRWVRLHYNAAGIPTILEIGYSTGTLTLRFTGPVPAGAAFTGNSWGE